MSCAGGKARCRTGVVDMLKKRKDGCFRGLERVLVFYLNSMHSQKSYRSMSDVIVHISSSHQVNLSSLRQGLA
eukprot:510236-Amphidinium_carterae.1